MQAGHFAPDECTAIGATTSLVCLTIRPGRTPCWVVQGAAWETSIGGRHATRPTERRHLDDEADSTAYRKMSPAGRCQCALAETATAARAARRS